jgi:hypothetical protein
MEKEIGHLVSIFRYLLFINSSPFTVIQDATLSHIFQVNSRTTVDLKDKFRSLKRSPPPSPARPTPTSPLKPILKRPRLNVVDYTPLREDGGLQLCIVYKAARSKLWVEVNKDVEAQVLFDTAVDEFDLSSEDYQLVNAETMVNLSTSLFPQCQMFDLLELVERVGEF